MADVVVAEQVAGAGADDVKADAPAVLLSAWFTKKAHKKLARAHKRFFQLQADGLIRYYSAVTPDGVPVDEKGRIRLFTDTKVKVDGTALVVSTLSKAGTDTRDWHLAAEEGTVAAEWAEKIAEVQNTVSMDSALHLRNLQDSKASDSQIVNKLGDKVAGSIRQAAAIMRTLGFCGSIKVTGLMFGLSLSMGIEVEIEQGEGNATTPAAPATDDDDDEDLAIEGTRDDDEEEVDPVNLSPEKETRFRKGLNKSMTGAMAKVKAIAYHMRRYNLKGTVGVGVSLTMYGIGIELEFEVGLSSAITEIEFEAMKERDAEKVIKAKAAKKVGAPK